MDAPKTHERIASLDFQRGLAIGLMVLLHAMEHAYSYRTVTEGPVGTLDQSPSVVLLGLIFAYFASWNSDFLLISATVNTLAMTRNAARGSAPRRILSKQLLTGASLGSGSVSRRLDVDALMNHPHWASFGASPVGTPWRWLNERLG